MTRTRNRFALLATSSLILALGACSSTQECCGTCGGESSMTISQAESMYGTPSKVRYSPDGSETWTWESMNKSITFMDGVATK